MLIHSSGNTRTEEPEVGALGQVQRPLNVLRVVPHHREGDDEEEEVDRLHSQHRPECHGAEQGRRRALLLQHVPRVGEGHAPGECHDDSDVNKQVCERDDSGRVKVTVREVGSVGNI